NVSDTAGNAAAEVTRSVVVAIPDITLPVITLNGNAAVNLTLGASYTDAGATALDNIDGDLTSRIVVTVSNTMNLGTTLDTAVAGMYTYHYNVSDTAGNAAAEVTRSVVVAIPDITLPVITLNGNAAVNLTLGASYTDAGATALDNIDGDLTSRIVVTISNTMNLGTTLDTAVAGAYTYHYNVSDTAGNVAEEKTRTVIVAKAVDTVTEITPTSTSTSTPSPTPSPINIISTNGSLTLPIGAAGEVSLETEVTISVPANATSKELQLTIEKLFETHSLLTNNEKLVSSVFEILKNFPENFSNPVTLIFAFDPSSMNSNQKAAVFYYDEVNKVWIEIPGGKIEGNKITINTNHFTKYAVLAVGIADELPIKPVNSFSDITGHWAEANIKQAVSKGIISGYPDGTFKPNATVTRAEFAVMLMNTLKPQGEGTALTFKDNLKIGNWAQKAVAQAVQAGIVMGYEDGTFRPDAEITRAEMAVMLANAMGQTLQANAATGFVDDKDIPAWAKGGIAFVKQAGIVQGKGDNQFAPQDHATRAEAVTVMLNIVAKKSE
ncbi:S-layer homology domain-containing protein, partial [Paenibacillus agricola]